MRITALALLLLLTCLLLASGPVGADEDPDELVSRFFQVGSLTHGRFDFIKQVMGVVSPDMVSDEENPLFGAEGEEPILPVGTVDELIELVKHNVDPVSWEITEGADVRAFGESTLYIQTTRRVMEQVAEYLAELEAELLTSVTVEVRAVRGELPKDGRLDEAGVRSLEAGPSVSLTTLAGQRATCFSGRQLAFLQDYDVEVAEEATISDPIVTVTNYGLGVAVRSLVGSDTTRLRVQLDADLVQNLELREHTTWGGTGEGARTVELPLDEEAKVRADFLVDPGVWHVVAGDGGGDERGDYFFLVRATPTLQKATPRTGGVLFGPAAAADSGPLLTKTFAVQDLMDEVPSNMGEELNLVPSNFTPPEPPELPEPAPLLAFQSFYDLIPQIVMPKSWNRQGAGLDVRMGRLMVTNTERALDAVAAALQDLRREFMWTVRTRAELVAVSSDVARELASPGADGYLLDDDRRKLLSRALAEDGARRVDVLEVVCPANGRNATETGRRISYLQDTEAELSKGATIANPVIQSVLSGSVLDVQPGLATTRDAVDLRVMFTRGDLELPIRRVETPHGDIEAPAMGMFRVRTNLRMPFGRTAVLGAGTRGDRAYLLLLTTTLQRYGD